MIKAKEKPKEFTSLTTVTSCFGLKRDAYYKYNSRADKRLILEQQIIEIVSGKRKSLPREAVRKLTKALDVDFNKVNIKVGRDTLFNILRKHQMLTLKYLIRQFIKLKKFKNLFIIGQRNTILQ